MRSSASSVPVAFLSSLLFPVPALSPAALPVPLSGVENVLCKSLGTDNVMNVVKATAEGLKEMQSPESVAERRGISVAKIYGWKE